jgi:HTH-type transcriptional regulator, sugar sensing transcriptional regulator
MIVKAELVKKIKDYFDLNIYETKVWLALISKGIASAGEVATISGVPRSRTYDVLETLEKRGFAIEKLGKPVKYLGVKPERVLEKMKNNAKRQAEEKLKGLSKIKETAEFTELEEIYREGIDPIKREDISAALRGRMNISNHLREILQEAEKEVIISTDAEELNLRIKLFKQIFDLLKKNGVKMKIALFGDKEIIQKVSDTLGIKIKNSPIDSKFFIVDRQQILFYLSKENTGDDTAIWLNSEFFANAFASMFDRALGGK